jgi:hypothetical protein
LAAVVVDVLTELLLELKFKGGAGKDPTGCEGK